VKAIENNVQIIGVPEDNNKNGLEIIKNIV